MAEIFSRPWRRRCSSEDYSGAFGTAADAPPLRCPCSTYWKRHIGAMGAQIWHGRALARRLSSAADACSCLGVAVVLSCYGADMTKAHGRSPADAPLELLRGRRSHVCELTRPTIASRHMVEGAEEARTFGDLAAAQAWQEEAAIWRRRVAEVARNTSWMSTGATKAMAAGLQMATTFPQRWRLWRHRHRRWLWR